MNIKSVSAYLSIPVIFATVVFIYALTEGREFSTTDVLSILVGSFFFYAAPFILWTFLVLVAKVRKVVIHAGFIGVTAALLLIASAWLGPRDPSGLPIQWMMYWPLAGILLVVFAGAATVYLKIKTPNKAFKSGTPESGAP